ncbi:hypothetical protein [Microbulbifer agarilyticus]|uniref:hypothetical protein n=1 Tax=Microbulbifer agarilyticus TaxID=260552 RepID=UPI001CD66D1E|nr:hypothetical protein [Microbulbifer agarilyticus]MCA0895120.1 hypothetical protein [Microbulbifer agarilyticus]
MKKFLSRWGIYLGQIFSPDVIVPILVAITFGYWSIVSGDALTKTVGATVMALFAGLAGAMLSKNVLENSRKGQIFTRGQSAVRGLNLILANLGTLEAQLERARAYADDDLGKDFSYIKTLSIVIQRQAVNSIEEWKDILPEADILELIEELKTKSNEQDELREALDNVQEQLDEAQNDSGLKSDELAKLRSQKSNLEKKLREKELEALKVLPSSLGRGSLFTGATGDYTTTPGLLFDTKTGATIYETKPALLMDQD